MVGSLIVYTVNKIGWMIWIARCYILRVCWRMTIWITTRRCYTSREYFGKILVITRPKPNTFLATQPYNAVKEGKDLRI